MSKVQTTGKAARKSHFKKIVLSAMTLVSAVLASGTLVQVLSSKTSAQPQQEFDYIHL